VKQAVLEVADEHVRRPHAVELAMVQSDAAAVVLLVAGERQSIIAPDLTQVQCRRVLLLHTQTISSPQHRFTMFCRSVQYEVLYAILHGWVRLLFSAR